MHNILKSGPKGLTSLPVDPKAKTGPKLYLIAGSVIPVTLRKGGRYVLADIGDKSNTGYTMCLLDGGWRWVNNSNIEGMSSKRDKGRKKRNVSPKT